MKFVPVSPGQPGDTHPSPERPSAVDPYGSLAVRIMDALVDDRRLLLVASDPLPSSWSIREAVDALHQQLHILELKGLKECILTKII